MNSNFEIAKRELHAKLAKQDWRAAGPGRAPRRRTEPHISDTAPPVWRAQEGPEGTGGLRGAVPKGLMGLAAAPVGGGGAWPGIETKHKHTSALRTPLVWRAPEGPEGLAAAPVGGGGAWPGFETTRRAKLAARTVNGRAAAHGHTTQHGLSGQASRWPETWRQPEIR